MDHAFLTVLDERHGCRAFTAEPVAKELVDRAVQAAGRAPSSKNTQPWGLEVVIGGKLEALREALLAAWDAGEPMAPDYRYSPDPLPEEMMARARACGFGLFAHKGIARDDKPARKAHDRENPRLFGAPAFAVLTLPRASEKGTFMDGGLFLGSFLLALRAVGYESTPMYSVACQAPVIRRVLGLSEDLIVVAGIAFGVEDRTAHVNAFRTEREPFDRIVRWHE
jgi:nitroreductase